MHLDLDKDTEEETYVWNQTTRKSEKVVKTAKGLAIFKAIVSDGNGGIATGYKTEKAASFPDWLEKAETGAIGRALAALGYGTQFAPELSEEHRIVDAPIPAVDRDDMPSDEQLERIRKGWAMCGKQGDAPIPETYLAAKALIAELTEEYKAVKATNGK